MERGSPDRPTDRPTDSAPGRPPSSAGSTARSATAAALSPPRRRETEAAAAAARVGVARHGGQKGLSLLGYHLCNYTLTKSVFKMVAYQKSYEKKASCGGWIPWMVCPQTHHRTEFHSVEVPETITLTDCCEGYEQVGLYCSLALNRSSVFASRPGICPVKDMETFDYPCTFDTECPGLKKCCSSSKGAGCVDPMPEGRMFWYNVTVLVKMDFSELIRVDSHLLNHSRLLHSMITGALQPLNASVHHIQSNHGDIYAGTVASQLLLGLQHPAPLAEVSSSLKAMVKRVYEVIDTQVQDVNECSYAEFNACPEKSSCVNLEGYYSCHPQHGHATVTPHWLSPRKEGMVASAPSSVNAVNTGSSSPSVRKSSLLSITNQSTDAECYPSAVTNHRILSVTSNSFEMSWLVSSTLNHTFHVRVAKGNETVQNLRTEEMQVDVSHLEAGVMYSVEIRYETCGKTIISHQNVKTEAKLFDVTMRILNYNFTDDFHNSSSSAYEEFSRILLTELENSFPPNISALYKSGKLKVQIESLAAGSIIVRLRITVQDPEFPVDASTFAPVLSYLHNGSVLEVDQQNTAVEDWDECASQADNDCSVFAECINLMGSYMCRCKTTMDTNPSRPGRNCEGEIVDPLTETAAPEIKTSTDLAPEEGRSPAGPAPTATMGTAAAAGPTSGATTFLPAALALGDKRASHNPTSAPPTPWQKGLSPQTAFSRDSSPVAMGVSASRALPMGTAAAAGPASGATTLLPAMLALGDKRVSHSPTSAPPAPWQKGLTPQMIFSRTSSPMAVGVTPSRALPMGTAAAAGLASGATTFLLAALALSDKRASHNPSSAPPMSWQKAFQKLSGTVRITNTEYSPGFNNNSSEENQTFAQLFVAEVQKSLPLEVLQQMDAGLIQVLVTGVTNGSTVVSFNLLLAEEVDAHHVISTFCEALEHSSHFTMDRSSLSTHALPFSQKATVTDKKPVNSAILPVTSLQTSAHVSSLASLDFSPAEHKALEDPMFSRTVLSPLTMDPMAAPDVSPQAPPAPLVKPAQEVSIKDAVSVFCEIERIVLAIQKRFLQQESIPESSLFLGEPGCNVSTSNGTHVVLQAGWSDCGTQVETNMTTTVVRTTLRNDVSAQGIIHHLNIASPIHCVFQNNVLTSSGFTAERLYTIFEDLHGPGYFRTEMQLFIGSSPVPRNFSVSASEDVLMEVGMQRADSQLKVVLTDCWATPTNNSVDPLPFVFISNSCPIPNTYTTLVENGNSSKAQFKMKIFSLVNNSVVYLHCRIRICVESRGSTCRTRCHARTRLLKAGETISLHRTSWGPLWKSAGDPPAKEAGVGIGSIILIALAVLGFVLGVVTLLIFQYQRKTGRCNLRIKSDNFSYQVFYD
ncbi:uromodulin-like 1 [Melospiza georgiana]|uniref:uromodulin-like 1 n=1 Tax=Melospiza georgiana TaxID=44398 RepID=UPI0025AB9581|nr:uromodulin-like 1 [Melospiza georgiana]